MSKLVKKLRREVTANPGKAGVLALLLLVAVYKWAPLLTKATTGKTTSSPTAAINPSAAPPPVTSDPSLQAPLAVTTAGTSGGLATTNWRDLLKALENDPRMAPATIAGLRDPFARLTTAAVVEPPKVEPAVDAVVEKEVTPAELGLKLTTTVVGSRRRVARINGQSYVEGQLIVADSRPDVSFRVRRIELRSTTLERQGKTYRLELPNLRDAAAAKGEKTQ